ncbi:MAG TPA: hypothetical protein VK326_02660 [Solirubrobacterales bacterium]|nr:hypothetical protein [Solirubrobacterales bacterium]
MTAGGQHGEPPNAGQAGAGATGAGATPPSDEEVRAAVEEQMRRLSVEDVLVQTVVTLVNLGARKLGLTASAEGASDEGGTGAPDLEQGRQAIDATRALLPLVSGDVAPIRDALSQLQVAYAQLAQGVESSGAGARPSGGEGGAAQPPGAEGAGESRPPGEPAPAQPPAGDPDGEKARSKIWTPPGA